MLKISTATVFLGGLAGLIASGAIAETFDAAKPVARPASTFNFETITPFLSFSDAYGDYKTTGHGTFGKFPPKMASPLHTHSSGYHGVVIKGVMTNAFNNEKDPPKMGPDSYWYVPANAPHVTACVSTTPCLFYFHSDSKFDFAVSQ